VPVSRRAGIDKEASSSQSRQQWALLGRRRVRTPPRGAPKSRHPERVTGAWPSCQAGGRSVRGENPLRTARRTGRANRVHFLDLYPRSTSLVFPTLQAVKCRQPEGCRSRRLSGREAATLEIRRPGLVAPRGPMRGFSPHTGM